jgi:F420-non-reducing hydrogenase large subunit
MKKITIDPITRLEGHGRIEIFLDDTGNVTNAYLQITELRGFEQFCLGRLVEEMPRITPKICGVCPEAHHLASTKALDNVFKVKPTPTAYKIRELLYCAHFIHSHIAHFYALAAPDFVLGPDADPAKRNILGVAEAVGLELTGEVIKGRAYAQDIQAIIAGRATLPVCGLPGGVSKSIKGEEREKIEEKAKYCLEFAKKTIGVFEKVVLENKAYVDLIFSDTFRMETYYMGLVDEKNKFNFYDGNIRVIDPMGNEYVKFEPAKYLEQISEHVEQWTYLKFPYLRNLGWKGFITGMESGIFRVAPLARLNVCEGFTTPLAQAEYDKYLRTLGGKPVHSTLANHWARVIEMLYAAERLVELSKDPEITDLNIRNMPTEKPDEGVGVVEAPRGTLIHHYKTDEKGRLIAVNLIVATGNNNGAICISVAKAARDFIKDGFVDQGILNMVEMAFRAYDPCFACATHAISSKLPIEIYIRDSSGSIIKTITN